MSPTPDVSRPFDIAVVGAGPAGLAFAAAMKQALGRRLRLVVIDPRPEARDGKLRAVALAEGSKNLIERIGAWSALEPKAQAIHEMAIFDGRARDAVRIEQLRFHERWRNPARPHGVQRRSHRRVDPRMRRPRRRILRAAVSGFEPGATTAALALTDGRELKARLVVAADGARSKLRALAGITTVGRDTGQTGIVATIAHERDHEGRAEQHFLPGGPFAILPMRGRFCSIVWNESHEDAETILALDDGRLFAPTRAALHPEARRVEARFARRSLPLRLPHRAKIRRRRGWR